MESLVFMEGAVTFFGRMTASISHEIMNVLAIINEHAGLMEDLALLSEKGRPLDPSRVKELSRKVKEQISRGNGIIKYMNMFAHSGDEPLKAVDPGDLLRLMAALVQRIAGMRGIELLVESQGRLDPLTTRPFLLENLLWLILDALMGLPGADRQVTLSVADLEGRKAILLKRPLSADFQGPDPFSGGHFRCLLEALGGEIRFEPARGEISLLLEDLSEKQRVAGQ